jgi:osmotically-inducible protein OsmY
MSDTTLQIAIMEALADNPVVHPDEISVEVRGDDATLRGTVGSLIQRAEAIRAASAVPGVRHVDDRLEVRLLGIDGHADADTRAAVLDAITADDEVHVGDIDVEVEDGRVTLSGLVELAFMRDRAERIALGVPGVESVHNELRVWLTVSADDVARHVTDALGRDALVGADDISVTVVDNDVTLAGVVTSDALRNVAVRAAASAPGVARVHDHLRVHAASA